MTTTRKQIKLHSATLSILSNASGKAVTFNLAPQSVVTVLDEECTESNLVTVTWGDKLLKLFQQDLLSRGTVISNQN